MITSFLKEKLAGVMLVAAFLAPCQSLVTKAETVTADFDNGLPEGWSIVGDIQRNSDRARKGSGLWSSSKSDNANYITTTEMEGEISFYARTYNTRSNGYVIFYKLTDDNKIGDKIYEFSTGNTSSGSISFKEYKYALDYPCRIGIALNYSCIDDFTYTPTVKADGARLMIEGYTSGSTFDFGGSPVEAGTVAEFKLHNTGSSAATINGITVTGDYTLTYDEAISQIQPGQSVNIEVATPDFNTSGELKIESDDQNSPYIIYLKSEFKKPAAIMEVETTPITFGKVESRASYELTINNTGNAPLEVKAESTSELFSLSPSSLSIEERASGIITVNFIYDDADTGIHTATITLTPNDGDIVEIRVSAKVADPNEWSEDFRDNTLPAGWEADDTENWKFEDGVAKGKYDYYAKSYLTTPTLIVEGPEDELSFDYMATNYYVSIVIEASESNAPFTEIKKISGLNKMSDYETCVISGLEAGSYKFRFKSDDYNLDNFEGLRLDQNSPYMVVSPMKDADFGKVTSLPEAKTYTVSNNGTGKYSVTITSSSEDFSVSPQQLKDIENGTEQTFTVTFNYNVDKPGEKSAIISIIPDYNPDATITFNAYAVAKDPNIWEEDFEEGKLPPYWTTTGWTVTKPSTYGNGTYMAYAGMTGSEFTLTTPRLYATEGQTLEFEIGSGTDDRDNLTVEYSHDLNDWEAIPGSPLTEKGIYTFSAPKEGYYYLKFNGNYAAVDNFKGFKLAPKEHDIVILSHQIPSQGQQYADYTATVNLKEMSGRDEDFEAVLYFNNEAVATVDETIEAYGTTTLQLIFTPIIPVDNAQVYVTVRYAGDESATTPAVSVNIAAAPVIDENGLSDNLETGNYESLLFKYSAQQGWNSIAVPFELNEDHLTAIFGEKYEVFELKNFDGAQITFQYPSRFAAGYPYMVFVDPVNAEAYDNIAEETEGIVLHNVNITKRTPEYDQINGVSFKGTFSPLTADGTSIFEITKDMLLRALKDGESIAGFRGYLTLPEGLGQLPTLKFMDGNGVETGLNSVEEETSKEIIFTLEGIRIDKIQRPGIYIINGNKVLKTQGF